MADGYILNRFEIFLKQSKCDKLKTQVSDNLNTLHHYNESNTHTHTHIKAVFDIFASFL